MEIFLSPLGLTVRFSLAWWEALVIQIATRHLRRFSMGALRLWSEEEEVSTLEYALRLYLCRQGQKS